MLCETFLTDQSATLYNIQGYDMISLNREKGQRGGIAIYVLNNFSHVIREDIMVNVNREFESLFIEINNKEYKVLVGEVYRVPNTNERVSIERFEKVINNIKAFKGEVILGTDQNFDLLRHKENKNIQLLLDNFIEASFIPVITKPTRVTHSSATLIDNIYIRGKLCNHFHSCVLETDISDHFPVISFVGKQNVIPHTIEHKFVQYRKFNDNTYANICNALDNNDWSILYSGTVNEAYSIFSQKLTNYIDLYAPLKTKKVLNRHFKREPWLTKGILISIKTKAKMFRKCKGKTKDNPVYQKYFAYNKLLNKIKRKSKSLYISSLFKDSLKNIKKTWQNINLLLGKTHDKTSITSINLNNHLITDQLEIVKHFAKYFANVGKAQSENIGYSNTNSEHYMNDCHVNSSAFFIPTDYVEVCEIISNLKLSHSKGYDNLSSFELKKIKISIALPLTIIINRCLSEGVFPDVLKIAKVVPIHKAKSKAELSNYRPISILSCISRVLEKVIFKRLYKYIEDNSILIPFQFGFRSKHSTWSTVSKLIQDILIGFENKAITLAVFCDLSKAFDTLDHTILLNKLDKYGIRGITHDLFKSYLNNRSIYVVNDSHKSAIHPLPNYGVPQGSVLGPLLFNIYINDIGSSLNYSNKLLYADDTTLYIIGKNISDLTDKMNSDLQNISEWFKANKLSLNISKTNYIIFSQHHIDTNIPLQIDSKQISKVNSVKFLGLYLDHKLTWENHINHIGNKVTSGLYVLNALKNFLTSHNLTLIYNSIIHCHLTYGCILWGNSLNKYMQKLIISQKKAMRVISHAHYQTPSNPLFKMKHIMKLRDIYEYQLCQYMYKVDHEMLPSPLLDLHTRRNQTHQYYTRHNKDFTISQYKCNLINRSFIVTGPKKWFKLSNELKYYSYKQFCKKLKLKVFSSY